jgi:hypothetical protein
MNTNDKLQLHKDCASYLEDILLIRKKMEKLQRKAVDIEYSQEARDIKIILIQDIHDRLNILRQMKSERHLSYTEALIQIIREPINKTLCI